MVKHLNYAIIIQILFNLSISNEGMKMAGNTGHSVAEEHAEALLRAAKKAKKGVDRRVDGYLEGTYDPKSEARKLTVRGVTTSLLVLSLLTGLAFSSPAEITEDQSAANYRPAPVVMDVDDFVNAPVDDEEDSTDEEKSGKVGIVAKFRQAVLAMPTAIRMLLVVPLWAAGTAILTAISFLWNILFASPLGAFIMSLFMGFAVLLGLFTVTAKALFPDVPIKKILCRRNVIIIGCLAVLLSGFDAIAPMYWHQYPLAAALFKLVIGGSAISYLSYRTAKFFRLGNLQGIPPAAL